MQFLKAIRHHLWILLALSGPLISMAQNLPPSKSSSETSELTRYFIESRPDDIREIYNDFFDAIEVAVQESHRISRFQKIGIIDQGIRALALKRNQQIDRAQISLTESLWRLRLILSKNDSEKRWLFHQNRWAFLLLLQESSSAILDRIPSVEAYSQLLAKWVDSFASNKSDHSRFIKNNFEEITRLMNQSTHERIFKVWVNRENIQTAAIAGLLAAQGACIILSAGVCAATLPATQGLTLKAAISTTQSAMAVTYGTINLVDRYRGEGLRGLTTLGAILDSLIIISGLPGPSKALLMSGYKSLSPQFFRSIATTQYQAGISAGAILSGYGSWQLLKAEKIAQNLQRDGVNTSAAEIRRQGAANLIFGGIALSQSISTAKQWRNGNEVERQLLEASKISNALKRMADRTVSTVAPYREIGRIVTKIYGGANAGKISIGRTLKDFGSVAYSTLFYHAAAVLSVAYPDFNHEKTVKMPALAGNEIALTLNGFDKSDLLYHAFESRHARGAELDHYQEGQNYFYDTFESADDLIAKIAFYGRRGKIKFLRIMAHGIPGKIATRALDIEGSNSAFFDSDFMVKNATEIQAVARLSMARDASIQITSCLVGANLDAPIKVRDFEIQTNAGDFFMKNLGETILINGGYVYSSRRMLLGFDATYGAVGAGFINGGPLRSAAASLGDQEREEVEKALALIDQDAARILADQKILEEKQKKANQSPEDKIEVWKMIRANSTRLVKTYANIWTILDKYGLKIEGPLYGTERSRIDHFEAKN